MTIIGITGGSGSGKTTIAKKLAEMMPPEEVAIIPQDAYYNDTSHMTAQERKNINFDHPDAFDWQLLRMHLRQLISGKAINRPTYSYIEKNRQSDTVRVAPTQTLIIEGIMTFHDKELREMMNIKIFVDATPEVRLQRNITRDTKHRGRTKEMVLEHFYNDIRPMHAQYIEPTKQFADIVFTNNTSGLNIKALLDKISDFEKKLLTSKKNNDTTVTRR